MTEKQMATSSQCLYHALPVFGSLDCEVTRWKEAAAAAAAEVAAEVAAAAAAATLERKPLQQNHQKLPRLSAQGLLHLPCTRCTKCTRGASPL
jgi:hypothetical protein